MALGARGKAVAGILLLLALALAGCSGKNVTSATASASAPSSTTPVRTTTSASAGTTTASPPSSSPTSSSTSPSPHPNHAPVIGAFSASRANATTLRFTFAMNASDPDGDALTWFLDPNGNGTRAVTGTHLPASVEFVYAAAGNRTASFGVSDGQTSIVQSLAVNATLAGNGTAVLFTFAADTTVPANPLMLDLGAGSQGAYACAGFEASKSGEDCVFSKMDAALVGHPFVATSSAGNADLEFWSGCGGGTADAAVGDQFVAGGTATGVVPDKAGCVILWDGGAGKVGTLTIVVS